MFNHVSYFRFVKISAQPLFNMATLLFFDRDVSLVKPTHGVTTVHFARRENEPLFRMEWVSDTNISIYASQILVHFFCEEDHPAYELLRTNPEVREFWIGPSQASIRIELSADRKSGTAYVGE